MKKGIKKIKFSKGQDSREAVMRKLALNFIERGHVETTIPKARALKSLMDRLSYKSLRHQESDKNVLLKHLGDQQVVSKMFTLIGPAFKETTGGFVTMIKLGVRQGDNAEMARIQWSKPIISEPKPKLVTETKSIESKKSTIKSGSKVKKVTKVTKTQP